MNRQNRKQLISLAITKGVRTAGQLAVMLKKIKTPEYRLAR